MVYHEIVYISIMLTNFIGSSVIFSLGIKGLMLCDSFSRFNMKDIDHGVF